MRLNLILLANEKLGATYIRDNRLFEQMRKHKSYRRCFKKKLFK